MTGCGDRSIEPFEINDSLFSIYGAIQLDNSPNYLRVRALHIPLLSEEAANFDATVTLSEIGSASEVVLRDTIVKFGNQITRNFIVEDNLQFDSVYKVTVEKSNGQQSNSFVSTPQRTEINYTPVPNPDEYFHIFCETQITFIFSNVRNPEFIRLLVGMEYNGNVHWAEVQLVGTLRHRDDRNEMYLRMSPRNLLVEIFPPSLDGLPRTFDRYLLQPTVRCPELESQDIQFRFQHFGSEWASANPLTGPSSLNPDLPYSWPIGFESGDIDNGLGFLGAYYENVFTIPFVAE